MMKSIFTVNPGTTFSAINGFPDLNTIPSWEIEINFTINVNKSWSGLLGNMRNTKLANYNTNNKKPPGPNNGDKDRGWGLWVGGIAGDSRTIHWSGASDTSDIESLKIQDNIPYKLIITNKKNEFIEFTLINTKTNDLNSQSRPFIPIVSVGDVWVGAWELNKTEQFNGSVASIIVSAPGDIIDKCDWTSTTSCIFKDYNGNNVSGCAAPDPLFNYSGLNSYDVPTLSGWLTTLYNRDGGNATVKAAQKSEKYNVYDYYNRCKDYTGYEFLKTLNFNNPNITPILTPRPILTPEPAPVPTRPAPVPTSPAPVPTSPNPVTTPFVQSNVSSITTPIVGSNAYSSDYLNLVGNLKLRGSSIVDGNLIVNNNGTQVAGISNTGDLMLKGGIVFGDSASNAWRLSADGNNFLIQKSGEQGISITSKGVVTPAPVLNINSWTFPKF